MMYVYVFGVDDKQGGETFLPKTIWIFRVSFVGYTRQATDNGHLEEYMLVPLYNSASQHDFASSVLSIKIISSMSGIQSS